MGHLTRIANHLVASTGGDDVTDGAETANTLVLGQLV